MLSAHVVDIVFDCHDSANHTSMLALAASSVLANSVAKLHHFPVFPTHFSKKIVARTIKIRRASSTLRIVVQSLNPVLHLYLYIITADALLAKNSRSVTERNPPATCPRSFILLYQLVYRLVKCFRRLDDIVVLPEVGSTKIIHPVEEGIT